MTLNELTDPLAVYVADFKHRRVLVLGDAILDEYLLGDCSRISPEAPVPVLKVNSSSEACEIVVISDYAKGFLSASLSQAIIRRAHEANRRVIVDPRPQHREYYRGCDYLTPNWRESRALLHLPEAELTPEAVVSV